MFGRFKREGIAKREFQEALYSRVVEELSRGVKREGLWAKAFTDADGAEPKAQSLYIKYRVQSLFDELQLQADDEEVKGEANLRTDEAKEISKSEDLDEPSSAEKIFVIILALPLLLIIFTSIVLLL